MWISVHQLGDSTVAAKSALMINSAKIEVIGCRCLPASDDEGVNEGLSVQELGNTCV